MSEEKEQYTVKIKDKSLFKKLTFYSKTTGRTVEAVTEEALRDFFKRNKVDDQPPGDDVFNPDPGA